MRFIEVFANICEGALNSTEFRVLMRRSSSLALSDAEIQEKFNAIDIDKSGEIELNEYLNYMADHQDFMCK